MGPLQLVWSCWKVLPMGCSWSLFLAQATNEERVLRSPSLRLAAASRPEGAALLHDRGPPLVLGHSEGAEGAA